MQSWPSSGAGTTSHLAGTQPSHLEGKMHSVSSNHTTYTVTHDTATKWILDSGATDHIVANVASLLNPKRLDSSLHLPNGDTVPITHIGNVQLTTDITLKDALCVPSFHCNLVSISKLTADSCMSIVFSNSKCVLQDPSQKRSVEIGSISAGLYNLQSVQAFTARLNKSPSVEAQIWHNRMGHPAATVINKMSVMTPVESTLFSTCDVCLQSKQHRLPFPVSESHTYQLFDLVHCDLWGPYKECTHGKCTLFLTIVEEYSKCTWVYLLNNKGQVSSVIEQFLQLIHTQFKTSVKCVRSDNGTEFTNQTLQQLFANKGIIHQTTCPYTPQQNGVVERKHQHLLNVARSLRLQAHLPKSLWGDCVLTAAHLINMLPVQQLNYRSPYEMLYKKLPDYQSLKVFGCLCYIADVSSVPDKLNPRGLKCVFLGYPFGKKGYRVLHLDTRKCYYSRDVIFIEDVFPFQDLLAAKTNDDRLFPNVYTEDINQQTPAVILPSETDGQTADDGDSSNPTNNTDHTTAAQQPVQQHVPVSRPVRQKQVPTKFKDYTGMPTLPSMNTSTHACVSSSNCNYPIQTYMSNHVFTNKHKAFMTNISNVKVPYTFAQAVGQPQWASAMLAEIRALEANNTWIIVPKPSNKILLTANGFSRSSILQKAI